MALAQAGKMPEAAREFGESAKLNPNDVDARFRLGLVLWSLGQTDEALAQFSEALRIRPDFADAREALDELMRSRGSKKH
jgi:tetratricopeptide (TPR) repeat protein